MVPIEHILQYGVHQACYSHCVFGNPYFKSLGLSDDELEDALHKLPFSDGLNHVVERGLNKSIIDSYLKDWTEEMNAQHANHPRYMEIMKRMQSCHKRLLAKLPEATRKYENNLESKIASVKRKIYGQDAIADADADAESTVEGVRKSTRIAQRMTKDTANTLISLIQETSSAKKTPPKDPPKNTPKKKNSLKKKATLSTVTNRAKTGPKKGRRKENPKKKATPPILTDEQECFEEWKKDYILYQTRSRRTRSMSQSATNVAPVASSTSESPSATNNERRKLCSRPYSIACLKDRTVRAKFETVVKHMSQLHFTSTFEESIPIEQQKTQHFMVTYDKLIEKPGKKGTERSKNTTIFFCPERVNQACLAARLIRLGLAMAGRSSEENFVLTSDEKEYYELVFGKKVVKNNIE